ncbi:MAG: sensor histidine kinase [bacterium]|nr:sensor histidine kinase [bacterium]
MSNELTGAAAPVNENGRLIRKGWRGWLTLYGIWSVPMLVLSGAYYYLWSGEEHAMSWWGAFVMFSSFYYVYASLCPVMYRITGRLRFTAVTRELSLGRLRLTAPTWQFSLVAHLVINALVVGIIQLITGVRLFLMGMNNNLSLLETIGRKFALKEVFREMIYFSTYYLVVVGAMLLIRWSRQRQQQEARTKELELQKSQLESQLTNAKLQTLRMQLRPHFLFNALNTISALVESKQNDMAFKTIAQLGDLLRTSLKLPESTTIPLRQELEFIGKYLTIEKIRFSDRLKTRIDVQEECREAMIPALILQPLVENCIHHAAAKQSEPLEVHIRAFTEGTTLVLEVSDNGPGLPRGWNAETHARVGLGNVRQRLQVMYGDASRLTLSPAKPKGVTVQVGIPCSVSVTLPPEPFEEAKDRLPETGSEAAAPDEQEKDFPGDYDGKGKHEPGHEHSNIDRR